MERVLLPVDASNYKRLSAILLGLSCSVSLVHGN
jgi:hypothetical protein